MRSEGSNVYRRRDDIAIKNVSPVFQFLKDALLGRCTWTIGCGLGINLAKTDRMLFITKSSS